MQNSHRDINQLRRFRQRLDLKQKQVAALLQVGTDAISRYENGRCVPTLRTALGMEIMFGVPLRSLFPQAYENLSSELKSLIEADHTLSTRIFPLIQELCPYEQQLALPADTLSLENLHKVRDHVTRLAKKLTPLWRNS